jgi:threonine aldolase
MKPWIDLRSDTVTRPTAQMRHAIAQAEVGDDVLGDDPTVIALQERCAELLGKEAACFVPTGTMANQTAIRAHTEPGDEIICHRDSHIIHYETGSPAALAGVMIAPLDGQFGQFEPSDVAGVVRAKAHHFANSKLVLIENTQNRCGGSVWALDKFASVCQEGRKHGLSLHLDGARLWNACAKLQVEPVAYTRHVDTVSVCFSKGLGTPAGSLVAGSRGLIARVHRFRKMFGGTMRQSGMLAAAAMYALDHHLERLLEDHAMAQQLADGLAKIESVSLAFPVSTNMVFVDIDPSRMTAHALCGALKEHGVMTMPGGTHRMRLVTHLDCTPASVEQAVAVLRKVLA